MSSKSSNWIGINQKFLSDWDLGSKKFQISTRIQNCTILKILNASKFSKVVNWVQSCKL